MKRFSPRTGEPEEIPPATPGIPVEPPVESPPGNPRPEIPPPLEDPGAPSIPQELPGYVPDELPVRGPTHTPHPANDAMIAAQRKAPRTIPAPYLNMHSF